MGYINCPKCGSINRDADAACFNCQADLTSAPPPPPPPPPPRQEEEAPVFGENGELSNRMIGSANPDAGRFKDLASRYVSKPLPKLDANIWQGLRTGIIASILFGALLGFIRTQGDDGTLRAMIYHIPALKAHKPVDIMIYSVLMNMGFGVILGGYLGLTNKLCFGPESAQVGAVMGAVGGGLVVYLSPPPPEYLPIALGLAHGWLLAYFTSLLERKVFRGQ